MLCIPLRPRSLKQLKTMAQRAGRHADFLEMWVDHLPKSLSAREIVKVCPRPVIIVNKPKREKGLWNGTEKERIQRLGQFSIPGVAYIDVGLDTDRKLVRSLINARGKTKIIVSYHNFRGTPSLETLLKKMREACALGADMVKIATYARRPQDNLRLLTLLQKCRKPLTVLAMGQNGKISRLAAPLLGSKLSFVALDSSHRSAPGQLTLDEYKWFDSLLKKT